MRSGCATSPQTDCQASSARRTHAPCVSDGRLAHLPHLCARTEMPSGSLQAHGARPLPVCARDSDASTCTRAHMRGQQAARCTTHTVYIVRDAQMLHDEHVGCVLPRVRRHPGFVHRYGRQLEERRNFVVEVESSFAVQIKAWNACGCCRTTPSSPSAWARRLYSPRRGSPCGLNGGRQEDD